MKNNFDLLISGILVEDWGGGREVHFRGSCLFFLPEKTLVRNFPEVIEMDLEPVFFFGDVISTSVIEKELKM